MSVNIIVFVRIYEVKWKMHVLRKCQQVMNLKPNMSVNMIISMCMK